MAKTKYNPLSAIREDPLAGLKQATAGRVSSPTPFGIQIENESTPTESGTNAPQSGSEVGVGYAAANRSVPTGSLSSAPVKPLSANLKPSRNTVYLYPEDLTKLRQLSGYASTEHGIRANDSMIVRAALSLIDTDVRFLHALKDAELSDRRRTARSEPK
jgi:hypothetical protein